MMFGRTLRKLRRRWRRTVAVLATAGVLSGGGFTVASTTTAESGSGGTGVSSVLGILTHLLGSPSVAQVLVAPSAATDEAMVTA